MKKYLIYVIIILVLVLGVWLWRTRGQINFSPENKKATAENSFGNALYQNAAVENPAQKLPETNPFGKNINPFTNSYKNPFAQ